MAGTTAVFHGSYTLGYLQYLDLETGHTLVAHPGEPYEIAVASGWVLSNPPDDGRWAGTQQALYPGPFSAVAARMVCGAMWLGSSATAQQEPMAMAMALREEAPPAHFTEADVRRWRQRAAARANRAAMPSSSPGRTQGPAVDPPPPPELPTDPARPQYTGRDLLRLRQREARLAATGR